MLSFLRKKTKAIMIFVAVVFVGSMFYGLGYTGYQELSGKKGGPLLKVNGKDVDSLRFNNFFSRLRQNFPEQLKVSDVLFIQNLALSQTIDFSIMLDEARGKVRVSGEELDTTLEQIAKQEKLNNIGELRRMVERSKIPWGKFTKIVKDEIVVQKRVNEVRSSVAVSPNDLREIRVSHILIPIIPGQEDKAKKEAEELKKRADSGENFAVLAAKYSQDPGSKNKGGDLGYFSTGSMVKPFEAAAFSVKVNEITGPIKTDFGYHVIKVTDARLKKPAEGTDVQAQTLKEKQEKAFQEWFYALKQKAKVEILDHSMKALDLRFKGKFTEAIEEYNKAIAADPGNAYTRLFLGLLYEEHNDIKTAILQYKEAVRIEPADPNMYLTLGKAYLKDNEQALAIEQFKKASLIAGDNVALHKELEKTFKSLGLGSLAAQERGELNRIEKKEAFERDLQNKASKIKTE